MNDISPNRRKSIRLPYFDYATPAAYYVTICTYQRQPTFGNIDSGEMILNPFGRIALDVWFETPAHFPTVELGEFVVMPNHIHGIIINVGVGHARPLPNPHARPLPNPHARPLPNPHARPLSIIVGSYKSAVTKRVNELRHTPGKPVWQRNYWEHIIRDDDDLARVMDYIVNNPIRWEVDELSP